MQYQNRHSIRLPNYDYSSPGAYFITFVTWKREHIFGEIIEEVNRLNQFGDLVSNQWRHLPFRFPNIQMDEFIVMPNHFHGIIIILDTPRPSSVPVGARQEEPSTANNPAFASPLQNASPLQLGVVIGSFKSTTARLINGLRHSMGNSVWQRNYYEHIIRSEAELQRIRAYIQSNPAQWLKDTENPPS